MYELLTSLALLLTIFVITNSNTIYALIYLIGVFLVVALLLIHLNITYIGLLYIIVYVGAIAILFLFVVIIIDLKEVKNFTFKNTAIGYLISIIFFYIMSSVYIQLDLEFSQISLNFTSFNIVESLGIVLYTWGGIWLIIAAIILLVCISGTIVLTLRIKNNNNTP